MTKVNIPAPYPRKPDMYPTSPWAIQCNEIDNAVMLIKDPDAFTQVAADKKQLAEGDYASLEKPKRRFFEEEGGCPAFDGILNGGCPANVICKLTDVQLHGYVEVKLCSAGRNYYCPIWQARGKESSNGVD